MFLKRSKRLKKGIEGKKIKKEGRDIKQTRNIKREIQKET
jgi:hypothetical protein